MTTDFETNDPAIARDRIEQTRARMSSTLDEIEGVLVEKKQAIQEKLDIRARVEGNPLKAAGIVFGLALVVGFATGGGRKAAHRAKPLIARSEKWEARARRLLDIARAQEQRISALESTLEEPADADEDDEDLLGRSYASPAGGSWSAVEEDDDDDGEDYDGEDQEDDAPRRSAGRFGSLRRSMASRWGRSEPAAADVAWARERYSRRYLYGPDEEELADWDEDLATLASTHRPVGRRRTARIDFPRGWKSKPSRLAEVKAAVTERVADFVSEAARSLAFVISSRLRLRGSPSFKFRFEMSL